MNNTFLKINNGIKSFRSPEFNYNFRISDGFFQAWGKTTMDNPSRCNLSPNIADIEITTSCNGPRVKMPDGTYKNKLCSFCYKSNTPNGKYMSFETFKQIINKFPKINDEFVLCQIAFGVDAQCKTNPDVWKIFQYCRDNNIVPNLTVADVDINTASHIKKYCGAVAVSRYSDKNTCYDTVDMLSNKFGMTQCNIHQLVSMETLDNIWETLKDIKIDTRLQSLNAIVFLSLKQKGRGISQTPIPQEEFAKIVQYCLNNDIRFGSDSCGAGKLLKSLTKKQYDDLIHCIMPCEATQESFYCDVDGNYYPCSFMANEDGDWKHGINMLSINDFVSDVWNAPQTLEFGKRVDECNKCLNGCCYYKI